MNRKNIINNPGVWIALGVAIGGGVGEMFDMVETGAGIGISLGLMVWAIVNRYRRNS